MEQHTCRWSVNAKKIRLGMYNLRSLLDNIKCMLLFNPALLVEVILKVGDVRLALFRFGEELLVGRDVHRRDWNL